MTTETLRQEDIAFQANLYESTNPTRRWLHNLRRKWVMNAIDRFSPSQPLYLEIGIGCGIYTKRMAGRGNVMAVDINPGFVAAANAMENVVGHLGDITKEAFPPRFDMAVCSEVLEHVPPALSADALKNLYASLKPGGYLVLTTPNSYSTVEMMARLLTFRPVVKLAQAIYGESVDDLGHINRLTQRGLRRQIAEAGFQVVGQDSLAFYIPGVAEFMGETGQNICMWFANRLEGTRLSWLLWTQCWLLRRPEK